MTASCVASLDPETISGQKIPKSPLNITTRPTVWPSVAGGRG
jgi:hypothetical protein